MKKESAKNITIVTAIVAICIAGWVFGGAFSPGEKIVFTPPTKNEKIAFNREKTKEDLKNEDLVINIYNGLTKKPARPVECGKYISTDNENAQSCYMSYGYLSVDYGGATVVYDPIQRNRVATIIAKDEKLRFWADQGNQYRLRTLFEESFKIEKE